MERLADRHPPVPEQDGPATDRRTAIPRPDGWPSSTRWSPAGSDPSAIGRRRRPVLITAALAAGLLAGAGYTLLAPATYQASASVLVQPIWTDQSGTDRAATVDLPTEAQLAASSAPVSSAAQKLNLTPDAVRQALIVDSPAGSQVLTIGFRAGTATLAAQGAQTVAEAYLANREASAAADADRRLAALQKQIDDTTLKINLRPALLTTVYQDALRALLADQRMLTAIKATSGGRVVSRAAVPSDPIAPNGWRDVPAGGVLGLAVGLLLAWGLPRWRRSAAGVRRPAGGSRPGRPAGGLPERRSTPRVTAAGSGPRPAARPGRLTDRARPGPAESRATAGAVAAGTSAALAVAAGPGPEPGSGSGDGTEPVPGTRRMITLEAVAVPEVLEPVTPHPALPDAAGSAPVPREAAATEPAGLEPAGLEPVGLEPVAVEPAAVEPVAARPIPAQPGPPESAGAPQPWYRTDGAASALHGPE